ncbi:MarR family winged helix-turn-helix transcriptional regulator [Streptomyces albidochromogenes]|uniref:MarR family winged helix-turn-helix transcriptional regulator n=1 Tax=Streptomyces albidochromogenes TaxID=329524 RepID=A0ABW6FQ79_9ACTN
MLRIQHSADSEPVAHDLCTVLELLHILWGRSQEAVPSGPLSPSQLRALTVLEGHDGVNLRALGEALGSRPSSVSRLCDRLEAAGFVERLPSPTSRREIEVHLSRRGRALLADVRTYRGRETQAVLQNMDPAGLAALAEGLQAFRTAAAARIGLPANPGDQRPARTG